MTENKVWFLVLSDKKPPKHTDALYNVEKKDIPDSLKLHLCKSGGWGEGPDGWYIHYWHNNTDRVFDPQPSFYEGDTYFKQKECMKEIGEIYGDSLIFIGFTLHDTNVRDAMGVEEAE